MEILSDRKSSGEHVNERDLRKHKYDVFRLLQIVNADMKIESTGLVKDSIVRFIEEVSKLDASALDLVNIGMPFDKEQGIMFLRSIYL